MADWGTTFTNSFNSAFANARRSSEADRIAIQKPFMENLMAEYERASDAIRANNQKQAAYAAAGQRVVDSIVRPADLAVDLTNEELAKYAAGLVAQFDGKENKAAEMLNQQLTDGLLVTKTDINNRKAEVANQLALTGPDQQSDEVSEETTEEMDGLLSEAQGESANEGIGGSFTPTPADATEVDKGPQARRFNLRSLADVPDAESGYGKQFGSYFFGKDGEYEDILRQDALVQFKNLLQEAGQLQRYNDIVSGKLTYTPISFESNIALDLDKVKQQPFPTLTDIKTLDEFNTVRIGLESGLYRQGTDAEQKSFYALGESFKARTFELPPIEELTSETKIKVAREAFTFLTPEQQKALPYGGARYKAIFALVEDDSEETGVTYDKIVSRLGALEGKSEEERATFINTELPALVMVATNTILESDENEEIVKRQLLTFRNRLKLLKVPTTVVEDAINIATTSARISGEPSEQTLLFVPKLDEEGNDITGKFVALTLQQDYDLDGKLIYRDPITKEVVDLGKYIKVPQAQLDQRVTIRNQLTSELRVHQDGLNDTAKMFGYMGEMVGLVSENPNVITARVTTGAVNWAAGISNELKYASSLLNQLQTEDQRKAFIEGSLNATSPDDNATKSAKEIEDRLNALVFEAQQSPIQDAAAQFQLYKAQMMLAVFTLGRLEGQSGMAMSNRDFERLATAFDTNNIITFNQNIKLYGQSMLSASKRSRDRLLNDTRVVGWEDDAKVNFFSDEDRSVPSMEILRNNGSLSVLQETGYDLLTSDTFGVPKAPLTGSNAFAEKVQASDIFNSTFVQPHTSQTFGRKFNPTNSQHQEGFIDLFTKIIIEGKSPQELGLPGNMTGEEALEEIFGKSNVDRLRLIYESGDQ
tara:strand:+ start:22538 stop:25168 length:2631 start_codon:yes stop_codon:yes gene_type:complete